MTQLLGEEGWRDIWRQLYRKFPATPGGAIAARPYAKDVGWRIDYQIATRRWRHGRTAPACTRVKFLTMRR